MEITILYYTANKENPDFEKKIMANLPTHLPIVSVSQKPIDLGHNICVGEHGNSYINEYRQIFIGLREIKTEYFIRAEADFLYPPDYFTFEPKGDNIYRSDNVWIVYDKFHKKQYSEGAEIARTDYMIKFLEHYLDGLPEWYDGRPNKNKIYMKHQKELWELPFTYFHTEPCLSFKTGKGVRFGTMTCGKRTSDLPYWGNIINLKEKYETK